MKEVNKMVSGSRYAKGVLKGKQAVVFGGKNKVFPSDLDANNRQYNSYFRRLQVQNNLCVAAYYVKLIGVSKT